MTQIVEKVRDWVSGEIFEMRYDVCAHCSKPIYNLEKGHKECLEKVRQIKQMEEERQRQEQSKKIFGTVLDPNTYFRRLYPDESYNYQEPWNNKLKREAREKEEAHYREVSQRAYDEKQLEWMEKQI